MCRALSWPAPASAPTFASRPGLPQLQEDAGFHSESKSPLKLRQWQRAGSSALLPPPLPTPPGAGGCLSQRTRPWAYLQSIPGFSELSFWGPWGPPQMALTWATCLNFMEHVCLLVTCQTQFRPRPVMISPTPVPKPAAGLTEAALRTLGSLPVEGRPGVPLLGESIAWWLLVGEVAPTCSLPRETPGFPYAWARDWLLLAAVLLAVCLWGPSIPWRGMRLCAFCPQESREGPNFRFPAGGH